MHQKVSIISILSMETRLIEIMASSYQIIPSYFSCKYLFLFSELTLQILADTAATLGVFVGGKTGGGVISVKIIYKGRRVAIHRGSITRIILY